MNPASKRFVAQYVPIADAISRLDIDQQDREKVAAALTEAFVEVGKASGQKYGRDFRPEVFRLLASDPLVKCAGRDGEPCPDGIEIRIPMHLSTAPDGRSEVWEQRPSPRWCVGCGAGQFIRPRGAAA